MVVSALIIGIYHTMGIANFPLLYVIPILGEKICLTHILIEDVTNQGIKLRGTTQKSKTLNMRHRNLSMRKRVNVILKNRPMWFY